MAEEARKPRRANPVNDTLREAIEAAWVRDYNPDRFIENLRAELELKGRLGHDWRGRRDG